MMRRATRFRGGRTWDADKFEIIKDHSLTAIRCTETPFA
jgi:hypothetical protein